MSSSVNTSEVDTSATTTATRQHQTVTTTRLVTSTAALQRRPQQHQNYLDDSYEESGHSRQQHQQQLRGGGTSAAKATVPKFIDGPSSDVGEEDESFDPFQSFINGGGGGGVSSDTTANRYFPRRAAPSTSASHAGGGGRTGSTPAALSPHQAASGSTSSISHALLNNPAVHHIRKGVPVFPVEEDELLSSLTFMQETTSTADGGRGEGSAGGATSNKKTQRRPSPNNHRSSNGQHNTSAAMMGSPRTADASFMSNASSSGGTEVAFGADVTRIRATIQEASHKMDRFVETLQATVNQRDTELHALRQQMAQMERNYEYNLDIIRERDEALQSAGVMIEQKHRMLKAAEDKCRRTEDRVLDVERLGREAATSAKQREVTLEAEVRDTQRRMEELELKHQHALHDRDLRLERERKEMRDQYEMRSRAEDEARVAVVQRLEKALADTTNDCKLRDGEHERELEAVRTRHLEAERTITDLSDRLRQTTLERDNAREKLANAERASYELQEQSKTVISVLTRRAEEAEATVIRGSHESEAAIRVEATRVAQMAADLAAAQANVAALEQRIVVLQGQRQTDATSYGTEMERIKTVMRQQIVEAEEQRTMALQRTETAITAEQTMETNLKELRRALEDKINDLADTKARHIETDRKLQVQLKQTQLLEERLYDLQSTTAAATDEWRKQRMAFEENERDFSRKWDKLVREQNSERERMHQQLNSVQQELQNLQREFHVSETARQGLQDQLSVLDDSTIGPKKTIDTLRLQNRDLNEKVLQLEQANDTIRKQVQLFTDEMHNDPLMQQAKAQKETIDTLNAATADLQQHMATLQQQLAEKDEEVARYQMQILTNRVEHESALRTAKSEGKAMAKEMLHVSGEDKRAMTAAMKEHELWHKKALQLEVIVQKMLKERQVLADEVDKLERKLEAVTKERSALSDANNVLRAQLEDVYAERADAAITARATSVTQQYYSHAASAAAAASMGRSASAAPYHAQPQQYDNPSASPAPANARGASVPPPTGGSAVSAVAREQEAKIFELEQKIQAMRAKEVGGGVGVGVTRSRSASGGAAARSLGRSSAQQQATATTPVVRGRSGAAVRHYGFN